MLSKKQFNAATERLQNIVTTSDLLEMLRHRLTHENKDNQYTDVISHLEGIPSKFSDKTPLDRRRAENYLAKTLYGKNHSQIAHLIKGSHLVKDEEFGKRAEMYGKFISNYGSDLSYGDCDLVNTHAKALGKRLRATSPDDFKISYQGYWSDANKFDYISQSNVLMYVSFLDLDIKVAAIEKAIQGKIKDVAQQIDATLTVVNELVSREMISQQPDMSSYFNANSALFDARQLPSGNQDFFLQASLDSYSKPIYLAQASIAGTDPVVQHQIKVNNAKQKTNEAYIKLKELLNARNVQ